MCIYHEVTSRSSGQHFSPSGTGVLCAGEKGTFLKKMKEIKKRLPVCSFRPNTHVHIGPRPQMHQLICPKKFCFMKIKP